MPPKRTTHKPSTNEVRTTREYFIALELEKLPMMIPAERVMKLLSLSRQSVHRLIDHGEISAVRLGPRTVRVLRDSLIDYLRRNMLE